MIVVGDAILSDDLVERAFVCDLIRCKGACCKAGDMGAPLNLDEVELLESIQDKLEPYLTAEGREAIAEQGAWVVDDEGDMSTPLMPDGACAYAIMERNGTYKCGIEHAWKAGVVDFQKPISCHLYPIRITEYDQYKALNYHRWEICQPACQNGEQLAVPIYKFLEGPLTRAFGPEWYQQLCKTVDERGPIVPKA